MLSTSRFPALATGVSLLGVLAGGPAGAQPTGRAQVMASADLQTQNSLREPKKLAPQESTFAVAGSTVSYTLAPNSFTVLRVAGKK